MKVKLSAKASEFIANKGGSLIIFRGSLRGCFVGNVPSPMAEIGYPRRPIDCYERLSVDGIDIFIDKDLVDYTGTAYIDLDKSLWWQDISFKYKDDV